MNAMELEEVQGLGPPFSIALRGARPRSATFNQSSSVCDRFEPIDTDAFPLAR